MKSQIYVVFLLVVSSACSDLLDVPNPNQPPFETMTTKEGIIALAQGGLYVNGLNGFFGGVLTNHERMGDMVCSALVTTQLSCPDNIILDNGSSLISIFPAGQKAYLRSTNVPGVGNVTIEEWTRMYSLNGAMNAVLSNADLVAISDDEKSTLKAWAYFWKGLAYSRIGSMYYAGIINDNFNSINNLYVTKEELLVEAEKNFAAAEALLAMLGSKPEYETMMDKLIPSICDPGKGGVLTTDAWIRNINSMRARNILVNTPVAQMSDSQWDQVLSFASNGVQDADRTFTARTDAVAGILGTTGYTAAQAVGPASSGGGGMKISERLVQEFKPGDRRFTNNFNLLTVPYKGPGDRGTHFNTRYIIVDKGKGMAGVVVMVNITNGAHELYIASFYEENLLMLAEANIYKGNIEVGLALIDELRVKQGAGLALVAGTGLTQDQAKEELRRERRVGLAFRGFSFYDARRWGILKNGRTGCVVLDFNTPPVVNTNATIQFGFLDYWDVPVREFNNNPPAPNSAPIVNPD